MELSSIHQNLSQDIDKRVLSELLVEDKVVPEKIIELPQSLKKKKQIYKKNSPKYKEFCNLFCTKFAETIGNVCNMNYDDVQKLFEKKIKRICIGGRDNSYYPEIKTIFLSEDTAYSDKLIHCFIHEALHGISAMNKRRNIFRTLFDTSDFMLEEGMTDFYTCCMLKGENKIRSGMNPANYKMQATGVSLLNKLLDSKQMINFYLNNDKTFIQRLNSFDRKAYSKIKKLLTNLPIAISSRGFDKSNMEPLDYFYSLVKANKLFPVLTIDDFKKNVDVLLEVYEEDLNLLSQEMYIVNGKLKNIDVIEERIQFIDALKNLGYTYFNIFKNILIEQWLPLNNNDETLFDQIIMEKISEKYPYVYPAVAFSNVFPNIPLKNIENEKMSHSSVKSYEYEKRETETAMSFENEQYYYNDFNSQYLEKGRSR